MDWCNNEWNLHKKDKGLSNQKRIRSCQWRNASLCLTRKHRTDRSFTRKDIGVDSLNRKLFGSPQPILIQEGKAESKNQICVRDGKVQRNKHRSYQTKFPLHQCMKHGGESNCEICRSFINGKWSPKVTKTIQPIPVINCKGKKAYLFKKEKDVCNKEVVRCLKNI